MGPADLGTCWIALDDATVDNGCMHVIPGSHLWPMRYDREDAVVDDPHWLLRQEGIPAGADLTPCPAKSRPGTATSTTAAPSTAPTATAPATPAAATSCTSCPPHPAPGGQLERADGERGDGRGGGGAAGEEYPELVGGDLPPLVPRGVNSTCYRTPATKAWPV